MITLLFENSEIAILYTSDSEVVMPHFFKMATNRDFMMDLSYMVGVSVQF